MPITASYLHALRSDSDLSELVDHLRANPTCPVFLHPKCAIWVQNDPDLVRSREHMMALVGNLDVASVNMYYTRLLKRESEYGTLCTLVRDRNLALYCINPGKLSIPDTLDQFYKLGSAAFVRYQDHRLQWIASTMHDYWGCDVLNDLLAIDRTVTDLAHGMGGNQNLQGKEREAYYDIQWMTLTACFAMANYELAFKKVAILKSQSPPEKIHRLILNCLGILQSAQESCYEFQNCYDTFNYTQLKVLVENGCDDAVYAKGLSCFLLVVKRKMLMSFLHLSSQVPLALLSHQFATPEEEMMREISWLIVALDLPFMVKDGLVTYVTQPDKKLEDISNVIDDNIIQGEALRTASLINLSFV